MSSTERWSCFDCGHIETSNIGELAGRKIEKTVGEGRRLQTIETVVCPECKSENWYSESVSEAFFDSNIETTTRQEE